MKQYENKEIKDFAAFIQYLSFLHSPSADTLFTEMLNENFDIDWYNCSQKDAEDLSNLLNVAKMVTNLIQSAPQYAVILPSKTMESFNNTFTQLEPYELLLNKLASQKLTESQIETELVKVSMLHRRKNMHHLYKDL